MDSAHAEKRFEEREPQGKGPRTARGEAGMCRPPRVGQCYERAAGTADKGVRAPAASFPAR
jgi:hypothetical protein